MPYAIAAGVIAAVGVGVSAYESNRARQDQKHANDVAMRQDQIKTQNSTAQMLQQNRITASQVFANSANNGTGGSSGSVGTAASINTQGAVQLNFMNSLNTLNQQRIMDLQNAEGHMADAGYAQKGASFASSVVGGMGGG